MDEDPEIELLKTRSQLYDRSDIVPLSSPDPTPKKGGNKLPSRNANVFMCKEHQHSS